MLAKGTILVFAAINLMMVTAYREELKRTISGCQNGAEVTDEELEEFEKPLIPKNNEEKCLMACVFKSFGVIVDGVFDPKLALAVAKDLLKSDPEKVKKITAVVEHCGDDIPKKMENDCELAGEIMKCYVKYEKEVGLA
ncbi:unnamed protein product [Nezara viridula]|uniref:Odorant binding protein 1 n=1 Tax=Nezara viridula TaxID=85310 RepID=A0A4Y5RGB5_NEZVI|nr:odorant binding protein 1 [Nezara viridula]CAH1389323.1 unnamed protein product [Nezara viridula]